MTEDIWARLNLNTDAGLGWRLCQATIKEDEFRSDVYHLTIADAFETMVLVQALEVLANPLGIKFETAVRIRGFHTVQNSEQSKVKSLAI